MLKLHNIFKSEKKLKRFKKTHCIFLLALSCPECEISLRIEAEGETKDVPNQRSAKNCVIKSYRVHLCQDFKVWIACSSLRQL